MLRRALITRPTSLIGFEAVRFFSFLGWEVVGLDFVSETQGSLNDQVSSWDQKGKYNHVFFNLNGDAQFEEDLFKHPFNLVIHPINEYSVREQSTVDDISATHKLFEIIKEYSSLSPTVILSSNKVYAHFASLHDLKELPIRYEMDSMSDYHDGFDENVNITNIQSDAEIAQLIACEMIAQEYFLRYKIPVTILRLSSVVVTNNNNTVEQDWLSSIMRNCYEKLPVLVNCGKCATDALHCNDLLAAIVEISRQPHQDIIYNLGGGKNALISKVEAIEMIEKVTRRKIRVEQTEQAVDEQFKWYATNTAKFEKHFPLWKKLYNVERIIQELNKIYSTEPVLQENARIGTDPKLLAVVCESTHENYGGLIQNLINPNFSASIIIANRENAKFSQISRILKTRASMLSSSINVGGLPNPLWIKRIEHFLLILLISIRNRNSIEYYLGVGVSNMIPGLLIKQFRPNLKLFYLNNLSLAGYQAICKTTGIKLLYDYMIRTVTKTWYLEPKIIPEMDSGKAKIFKTLMSFQTDKGVVKNRQKLLMIAPLINSSGIQLAIKSLAIQTQKYPDLELIIIGEGPLKKPLLELSTQLGIDQHVQIIDKLTESQRIQLIASCGIGLNLTKPTYTDSLISLGTLEMREALIPIISTTKTSETEQAGEIIINYQAKDLIQALDDLIRYDYYYNQKLSEIRSSNSQDLNIDSNLLSNW